MRHVLLSLVLVGGCAELHDDDHVHPDDLVDGHNKHHVMQGQAVDGRWVLPGDVAAAGEQQDVPYDDAPPYNDGENCSGGPKPGALTLRDHLIGFFPQIETVGIYNCRVIAGTNSMSLHGVGRALDVMLPTVGGDADNDLGDPIAEFLVVNAEVMGIQQLIWDHTVWRSVRVPQSGAYSGVNPHVDHVHVELTVEAGNENVPWFDNPFGPQVCEPLEPNNFGNVVVDEGDACFALFGPAQFWRHEDGAGHGGSLAWTNAFEGATKSNWARWSLPLAEPGEYLVEVYVDATFGVFSETRYKVSASGAQTTVTVDQGAADGWTALGMFTFDGSPGEQVIVVDNDPDGPVADDQHIVADALRLRPASAVTEPPPPPPPPDDPGEEEPPPPDDENPEVPPVDDDEPLPVDDDELPPEALQPQAPAPPFAGPSVDGGCNNATGAAPSTTLAALACTLLLLRVRRRR